MSYAARSIALAGVLLVLVLLLPSRIFGQGLSIVAHTATDPLTSIEPAVSINDFGRVAFSGNVGSTQGIFVGGTVPLTNITPGFASSSRTFQQGLQINNSNLVAAIDRTSGSTVGSRLRLWDATGTDDFTTFASASSPPGFFDDWSALASFTSLSNDGRVSFQGLNGNFWELELTQGGSSSNIGTLQAPSNFGRPMTATGGATVAQIGSGGPIALYRPNSGSFESLGIATEQMGFSNLGRAPGISDDGLAVAFYGELSSAGADTLNAAQAGYPQLQSGPGIFASIQLNGGQTIFPVSVGLSSYDSLSRVSIERDRNSPGNTYSLVFIADSALYANTIETTAGAAQGMHRAVVSIGDMIPNNSSTVSSLSIFDPLNGYGQAAFWANMSDGTDVVLQATVSAPTVALAWGVHAPFRHSPIQNAFGGPAKYDFTREQNTLAAEVPTEVQEQIAVRLAEMFANSNVAVSFVSGISPSATTTVYIGAELERLDVQPGGALFGRAVTGVDTFNNSVGDESIIYVDNGFYDFESLVEPRWSESNIERFARLVAHEVGHTFGLRHVSDTSVYLKRLKAELR